MNRLIVVTLLATFFLNAQELTSSVEGSVVKIVNQYGPNGEISTFLDANSLAIYMNFKGEEPIDPVEIKKISIRGDPSDLLRKIQFIIDSSGDVSRVNKIVASQYQVILIHNKVESVVWSGDFFSKTGRSLVQSINEWTDTAIRDNNNSGESSESRIGTD